MQYSTLCTYITTFLSGRPPESALGKGVGEEKLAKKSKNNTFENILLEAIEEVLSGLGENVKTAIFFHLEENFNTKKKEIPQKIMDFQAALEQVFGLGARNLEILFMKSLHSKIELVCKWPTWCKWVIPEVTFQEYICLMKRKFEEVGTRQKDIQVFINVPEEIETTVHSSYPMAKEEKKVSSALSCAAVCLVSFVRSRAHLEL